jgi:hydroxypyruvate isomerase
MGEPSTTAQPIMVLEKLTRTDADEATLLVAALSATLVEYHRSVGQRNNYADAAGAGRNWRMLARLEQLRGQA